MTIFSPRLALNLNYLLSCRNAFCPATRATTCHTTPPLSFHATFLCWLVVTSPPLSLRHHLSCAGCLLNCHLSPRIATSLYHALRTTTTVAPWLHPCRHRRHHRHRHCHHHHHPPLLCDLFDFCICSVLMSLPIPHPVVAILPTAFAIVIIAIVIVVAIIVIVIVVVAYYPPCWRSSISVLILILLLVSTGRGCRIHLASKIPFYLL